MWRDLNNDTIHDGAGVCPRELEVPILVATRNLLRLAPQRLPVFIDRSPAADLLCLRARQAGFDRGQLPREPRPFVRPRLFGAGRHERERNSGDVLITFSY